MKKLYIFLMAAMTAALLAAGAAACAPQEKPSDDESGGIVTPVPDPDDGKVTLTLDAQGGTLQEYTIVAEKGAGVVLPSPERNGYLFDGWYLSEADDAQRADGAAGFEENTTLYAKYTLLFSYDGEAFTGRKYEVGDVIVGEERIVCHRSAAVSEAKLSVTVDGEAYEGINTIGTPVISAQGEGSAVTFPVEWMCSMHGDYVIAADVTFADGKQARYTIPFTVEESGAQAGDVLLYTYGTAEAVYSQTPPVITAEADSTMFFVAVWYAQGQEGTSSAFLQGKGAGAQPEPFLSAAVCEGEICAATGVCVIPAGGYTVSLVLTLGGKEYEAEFDVTAPGEEIVSVTAEGMKTAFTDAEEFVFDGSVEAVCRDGTVRTLAAEEYTVLGGDGKPLAGRLAAGEHEAEIVLKGDGQAGDAYTFTVSHAWGETDADGYRTCGGCSERENVGDARTIQDTFTAGAWNTALTFEGSASSPVQAAGMGATYGTLERGQTITLSGTFDSVSADDVWDTPLVGAYAEGTGVLLRMDNWTITEAPGALFSNPAVDGRGSALSEGAADVFTTEWRPFRTGRSWDAADAAGGEYTLEYSFGHDSVMSVRQSVTANGLMLVHTDTFRVPLSVEEVNTFLYGEQCAFTFTSYLKKTDRAESVSVKATKTEYYAGEQLDYAELVVTAVLESGQRFLSEGEYVIKAVTADGEEYFLGVNAVLEAGCTYYAVYGGKEEKIPVEVKEAYSVTVSGEAELTRVSEVTVTLGGEISAGMRLSVNGEAADLASLEAGSVLGGLTVLQTESTREIVFSVPAFTSREVSSYSLALLTADGRTAGRAQIFFRTIPAAEENGFVFSEAANAAVARSADGGEVWLLLTASESGTFFAGGVRFSVTTAEAAALPALDFSVTAEGTFTGDAVLNAALEGIYSFPAQGAKALLAVLRASAAGGALELIAADGRSDLVVFGEETVRYSSAAAGERVTLRAADCGNGEITALAADGYYYAVLYGIALGGHDWSGESCAVCGARRYVLSADGTQYEADLPPAQPVHNTDLSDTWWNEGTGSPVGRDLLMELEGDFAVRFTWEQAEGSRQMYGIAQLYRSENGADLFWTLQGEGHVDGSMTAGMPAAERVFSVTKNGEREERTSSDNAEKNPFLTWNESEYGGSYVLDIIRTGSVLFVRLTFTAAVGDVYEVTCTQAGFSAEGVWCFLAGNPALAENVAMSVGSVTAEGGSAA